MKAVDGSRIEPISLNHNDALNLGETINLNGSNVTIQYLDRLYYTDRRVEGKTKWQLFSESLFRSAGWSAGAAAVSAIGVLIFNIIKAQRRTSN